MKAPPLTFDRMLDLIAIQPAVRPQCPKRETTQRQVKTPYRRDAFGSLVEKMTNHERSLWARAGYPGLKNRDIAALRPHARAAERRQEARSGTAATGKERVR